MFMMTIGYIRTIILITPSASCIIAMVNSFQLNLLSSRSSASSVRNFPFHTRPFQFREHYPRRNNKARQLLLFQSLIPRDGSNNNDNDYYLSQSQQASQSPPTTTTTTTTTGAASLISNDESNNAMTSTAAGGGEEDEAINHYNNYDPVSATADADAEDGRTEIIGDWYNFGNFGGSNNADMNSHPTDDDNDGDDDFSVDDNEIDDDDYNDNTSTTSDEDDDRNNVYNDMTTSAMGVTEFVNQQIGGNDNVYDNVYDDKYENKYNNNKYNNNASEMTTLPPTPANIDIDDIQIAIDALTTMDIPHEVLLNINGEPIEVIVPNNGVVVVTTDMDIVEEETSNPHYQQFYHRGATAAAATRLRLHVWMTMMPLLKRKNMIFPLTRMRNIIITTIMIISATVMVVATTVIINWYACYAVKHHDIVM
jgi:hypothetical protein